MSSRSKFDTFTNVAIILAAIALVATQVKVWRVHGTESAAASPARTQYTVGEVIPNWSLVNNSSNQRTLLVVVNSGCRFCTDSMGFYGRLAAAERDPGVRLVVASRESVDQIRSYLRSHNVEPPDVVSLPRDFAPKLVVTPTILLIEPNGTVTKMWTGRLPSLGEGDVLATVAAGA